MENHRKQFLNKELTVDWILALNRTRPVCLETIIFASIIALKMTEQNIGLLDITKSVLGLFKIDQNFHIYPQVTASQH